MILIPSVARRAMQRVLVALSFALAAGLPAWAQEAAQAGSGAQAPESAAVASGSPATPSPVAASSRPGPVASAPAAPAMVLGLSPDNLAERTEALVDGAMRMIGAKYRWQGDEKPAGFDAGTFVRFVLKDAVGLLLPVRVENLGRMGEAVRAVDLKPGDLVFFNTMRRAFSHVGIYLGENKFIHATARGAEVRVDDLQNAYWDRRFDGARRITPDVK